MNEVSPATPNPLLLAQWRSEALTPRGRWQHAVNLIKKKHINVAFGDDSSCSNNNTDDVVVISQQVIDDLIQQIEIDDGSNLPSESYQSEQFPSEKDDGDGTKVYYYSNN